jgi:hypothetical protein
MFNRHNFEIAKLLNAEDDSAAALRGVYITPDATYVTDGHIAVKVTAPEIQPNLFEATDGIEAAQYFTGFILDRDTALKVAKAIPKKGDPSSMIAAVDTSTEVNGRSTIAVNEIFRQDIIRSQKLEGTYPDINKFLLDPDKAKFTVAFSVELLAGLLAAAQSFCRGMNTGRVVLRLYGPSEGMRLDADGLEQKFTAMIMPLRSTSQE